MRKVSGGWAVLAAVLMAGVRPPAAAAEPGRVVLLVPARPRVVQLAQDLAWLRPEVAVVAWHGAADTAAPVLHAWSGANWVYVSPEAFATRQFISGPVALAVLVGESALVPRAILADMSWCPRLERLETLALADLVNGLDRSLHFQDREWRWLADRHGLALTDLNAARRQHNPYDTPRSRLPLAPTEFQPASGQPPPAQLIRSEPPPPEPVPAPPPPPPPEPEAVSTPEQPLK